MFSSTIVTAQRSGHSAASVASPNGGFSAHCPGSILDSAHLKLQKLSGNRGLISRMRAGWLGDSVFRGIPPFLNSTTPFCRYGTTVLLIEIKLWKQSGLNLVEVRDRLGRCLVTTVKRYTHLALEKSHPTVVCATLSTKARCNTR